MSRCSFKPFIHPCASPTLSGSARNFHTPDRSRVMRVGLSCGYSSDGAPLPASDAGVAALLDAVADSANALAAPMNARREKASGTPESGHETTVVSFDMGRSLAKARKEGLATVRVHRTAASQGDLGES